MPNEIKRTEDLQYDATPSTNSKGSVVLGHLSGPCADIINPTRNGRRYSEQLWEKVFNDPIVNELFNCGGIFGELGHPTDREETDMEKIAVCMPEKPTKDSDGHLVAKFDILDTPNGRILKTLCDYGYKMGISSRGSGDTFTDYDGQEAVDPESYQFNGFDIVLIPAVKSARLKYNESLNNNRVSFRQALAESLNKATEDERKIMKETLNNLDISLDESARNVNKIEIKDIEKDLPERISQDWFLRSPDNPALTKENRELIKDIADIVTGKSNKKLDGEAVNQYIADLKQELNTQHESDDIDEVSESIAVANDKAMVEELQNTLKQNHKLEQQVMELQEKLSVCYAKENKLTEEAQKHKLAITNLSKSANKSSALSEKLSKLEAELNETKSKLTESENSVRQLKSSAHKVSERDHNVRESLANQTSKIKSLQESITKLNSEHEQEKQSLVESYETLQRDFEIKRKDYSAKLEKANKLVEKYQIIANKAVDKYIESQAVRIGVSVNEVKNKLPESYNFNDIDSACDDLQKYQLGMSKLPFHTLKEEFKVKATPSKNEFILPVSGFDDDVDEGLLSLAGMNK